jgi:hypothetical protein
MPGRWGSFTRSIAKCKCNITEGGSLLLSNHYARKTRFGRGSLSRAAVMLINEAGLRIDQDSTVYLTDIAADDLKPSIPDLTRGAFQSFSRQPPAS